MRSAGRGTWPGRDWSTCCTRSDVVIANDAATLPASLRGTHAAERTRDRGSTRGTRRRSRRQRSAGSSRWCSAKAISAAGPKTVRSRPRCTAATGSCSGRSRATVVSRINHPRLVLLQFDGTPDEIWAGLARHGHPVQYSYLREPLAIWDTWTPIAGLPVAFEPPSAGFALSWSVLESLAARGIGFGTLTHAAGLSSTGDPALDAMLPFDEPYLIPRSHRTARSTAPARVAAASSPLERQS